MSELQSCRSDCQRGFTLVELLIVAIFVTIFAAIVASALPSADHDSRVSSARHAVKVIQMKVNEYRQVKGTWPIRPERDWFRNYVWPRNPFVPDHKKNLADDVDGSNNPDKWHPSDKTTTNFPFWYNRENGTVRIRVPRQATDALTLALYNEANGTAVSTLSGTALVSAPSPNR